MNTVRLDRPLQEKLRLVARKRGMTLSEVHRAALEAYCAEALQEPKTSRFDDVAGVIEGPSDLAETVGRRYADAMAEKHARHAR